MTKIVNKPLLFVIFNQNIMKKQEILDFDAYLDSENESKKAPKTAKKEAKKPSWERNIDHLIAPTLRQKQPKKDKNTQYVICPDCAGIGRLKSKFIVLDCSLKTKEETISDLKCSLCAGYGKITLDEKMFIDNLWCQCREETEAYYVPDGANKDISKHHWRCSKCKKVKKIG